MNRLLILLAFIAFHSLCFPQQVPIEWGKIPLEDLVMKSYPLDTNAAAVILCDYGESTFTRELDISFRRHRRIKILTPGGYDWGIHAFTLYTKDRTQRVSDIEGATFVLDSSRKITKREIDSKAIFEENLDGKRTRVRFALPALAPGAVIEYRYTITSKNLHYIEDWEFQTKEPTRWSEYRATIPNVFKYASVSQGYEKFHIDEVKDYSQDYSTFVDESREYEFRGVPFRSGKGLRSVHYEIRGKSYRWVMKDVPALREEPYVTTVNDHIAKITFQLSSVEWPGEAPRRILHTWDRVVEELLEAKDFGKQLNEDRLLRREAESITSGIGDATEKLKALYAYVQKSMSWNGRYAVFADQDLDDVFAAKTGNSGEIAMILISMLRITGIEAHPVLVSTRSHGKIQDIYPIVSQFNHVLAYAAVGEREYLLDAISPSHPFGLLSVDALNHTGLAIVEGSAQWIPIVPQMKFQHQAVVNLALSEDGLMVGDLQCVDSQYGALEKRNFLRNKNETEMVKAMLKADENGLAVDSFTVSNKTELDKPIVVRGYISSSTYANRSGDFIYINPIVLNRASTNPLKLKGRKFPIDMPYARDEHRTTNLTIPDGYTANELPPSTSLRLSDNGAEYRRLVQAVGNSIQLVSRFTFQKTSFEPERYKELQEFFEGVVALESEQIVLKKKTSSEKK